jgi:hypothetical protein
MAYKIYSEIELREEILTELPIENLQMLQQNLKDANESKRVKKIILL